MDWSVGEGLYNRFKLWKQQCELLFSGPLVKLEEPIQCKYLLYWSGERGLELCNSWDLSEDEQKILRNYFERFENFVKPHSNELIAACELYKIKQTTLSLEEFIAKLRLLIKEANYPTAHHERFLRDFLVFGMNSQRVREECLKQGISITFQKAKDLAKAEESADTQLKLMNKTTELTQLRITQQRKQESQMINILVQKHFKNHVLVVDVAPMHVTSTQPRVLNVIFAKEKKKKLDTLLTFAFQRKRNKMNMKLRSNIQSTSANVPFLNQQYLWVHLKKYPLM